MNNYSALIGHKHFASVTHPTSPWYGEKECWKETENESVCVRETERGTFKHKRECVCVRVREGDLWMVATLYNMYL